MLIECGADINAQVGYFSNALQVGRQALADGHEIERWTNGEFTVAHRLGLGDSFANEKWCLMGDGC